jgi:hypothetical protein
LRPTADFASATRPAASGIRASTAASARSAAIHWCHSLTRHDEPSAGPLQKVIEIAGPDAVRQVMRDVLEADRKPDGELRQDNVFRYVAATKE